MPERLQQPCPMMAGTARFDRDHRRCKLLEERHHFLAPQLLAQNRHLGGIHPVKLENMLRRVHSNPDNLFHGRSPVSEISNGPQSGTVDAVGGRPHQQQRATETAFYAMLSVVYVKREKEGGFSSALTQQAVSNPRRPVPNEGRRRRR